MIFLHGAKISQMYRVVYIYTEVNFISKKDVSFLSKYTIKPRSKEQLSLFTHTPNYKYLAILEARQHFWKSLDTAQLMRKFEFRLGELPWHNY